MSNLRRLTKEALRTGKIQFSRESDIFQRKIDIQDGGIEPVYWDRFNAERSWEEFELSESAFRNTIKEQEPNKFSFIHNNPGIWINIIKALCSVFFIDDVYSVVRSDGKDFSLEFIKYVKRVLSKLPIHFPDKFTTLTNCEVSEHTKIHRFIKHSLDFSKAHILPFFKRKQPCVARDPVKVEREKLAYLWSKNQKQAINIVKNNGFECTTAKCEISEENLFNHFSNKCKDIPIPDAPLPYGEEATPPPPSWVPLPDPFTQKEVRAVIKKLPRGKSPGKDRVSYDAIKKRADVLTPAITAIFNVCLAHRRIPTEWKEGLITLLPKTENNLDNIDNWRPISLLSSFYKIFMCALQNRLMPWIVDTTRLSQRQKGSLPRNGLQEHVFCLQTAVRDFLHSSSKLFIEFVDLRDAFGSLNHPFMFDALSRSGYPLYAIQLIKDAYNGSSFCVKYQAGITQRISRGRGIIQGCPISVIAFEQAMDAWLRWINHGFAISTTPCPIQGYVDDISMISTSVEGIRDMTQKTDLFVQSAGMQVKHRKCALLHGQRSGCSWYTRSKTHLTELFIQEERIPIYPREQSYKYLGYEIRIDNVCEQTEHLIQTFKDMLVKIDSSLLPTCAKIESINVICMSSISFYFPNMIFLEKQLDALETEIVSYVRHWLGLNKSSTRSFMFLPRSKGGLGLINPRLSYYSKHLAFVLSALNSDDMAVRNCARTSLSLHFSKRKAVVDPDSETSFAGYAVDGNKIVKLSKVYWPRSNWLHVFEMCQRENMSLNFSEVLDCYKFSIIVDENTSFNVSDPKIFQNIYKNMKIKSLELKFTSLASQGRVARETRGAVDTRFTSVLLTNTTITNDLISFVYRSRLQLLQCNSLLHTYYASGKHCRPFTKNATIGL